MKQKDRWFNAFLLIVVAAACGAAFLLPDGATQAQSLPVAAVQTDTPLASYRKRRDAERALMMSSLKTLLTSEMSDENARALAQTQLLGLTDHAEHELALEAAAAGMGIDAACAVREELVILSTATPLDSAQANGLLLLAQELTGISADNVRILSSE